MKQSNSHGDMKDVFDLQKFTSLYIEDNGKWRYLYHTTFFDLPRLVSEPVIVSDFFVKEVSVTEMLSLIERKVSLEWFVDRTMGTALIRKSDNKFQVYYEVERGLPDQIVGTYPDIKSAVLMKLRKDLWAIQVQNIKD